MRPMNQPTASPLPDLDSQANAWVVRITSGQATVEDARALKDWCALSPAHAQAYRAAAQLWKQTGRAAPQVPRKPRRLRRMLMGAVAAGVLLAVFAPLQLGHLPDAQALLADHATTQGERRRVELPDGSVAELDARTRLDVDFSGSERRIRLGSGAAIFHVTHDAQRPFVVSADDGSVTALGTVFEVRHQHDGIRVTCSEGVVAVRQAGFEQALLHAGEQLTYDARQGPSATARVDTDQALAWRQGLLVFKNRPLQELVDELNRYHSGRILLANERIARMPVSGVFHLQRPDEALKHIESSLQLSATRLPAGLILLR